MAVVISVQWSYLKLGSGLLQGVKFLSQYCPHNVTLKFF